MCPGEDLKGGALPAVWIRALNPKQFQRTAMFKRFYPILRFITGGSRLSQLPVGKSHHMGTSDWCPGEDLNLHALASTCSWSMPVYHFSTRANIVVHALACRKQAKAWSTRKYELFFHPLTFNIPFWNIQKPVCFGRTKNFIHTLDLIGQNIV